MQKILKHCAAVLGRVIFIGFGIQILLGVLWMYDAFAGMDSFGEGIVCVGQILLLGSAVWFAFPGQPEVKRSTGQYAERFLRILGVITFPMVLQCVSKPDVRVLMAVSLLVGAGCVRRYRRSKKVLAGVCICLLLGIVAGSIHEPMGDLLTRMGSRIVWTTLYKQYERVARSTVDEMDYDKMVESTYEATGIETILMPSLEETLGRQRSREILKEFIAVAWESSKGTIIKEMLWDEAGYLVSPVIVPLQLAGRAYESYSGLDYREFLQPSPKLGSFYMRYGCLWFAILLVLRGAYWMAAERRIDKAVCVYIFLTAGTMSLWYTLSGAGKMDYKNTMYILCVWLMWMTDLLKIREITVSVPHQNVMIPEDKEEQPHA